MIPKSGFFCFFCLNLNLSKIFIKLAVIWLKMIVTVSSFNAHKKKVRGWKLRFKMADFVAKKNAKKHKKKEKRKFHVNKQERCWILLNLTFWLWIWFNFIVSIIRCAWKGLKFKMAAKWSQKSVSSNIGKWGVEPYWNWPSECEFDKILRFRWLLALENG